MWRKLNEEEKRNFTVNYLFGVYLFRFVMGAWLLFVTVGYLFGIPSAFDAIARGDYFSGVGSLIAGTVAGIVFYGIPIILLRRIGPEGIQALKEDEVYLGEAFFVSGTHSYRSKKLGRGTRFFANVRLIDEYGNATQEIKCRSIGNLKTTCKVGEKIAVLKVVKASGDELIAMKHKII